MAEQEYVTLRSEDVIVAVGSPLLKEPRLILGGVMLYAPKRKDDTVFNPDMDPRNFLDSIPTRGESSVDTSRWYSHSARGLKQGSYGWYGSLG